MSGYENQSAPKPTQWTPVTNPEPVFDSAAQKRAIEQAQANNPRREDESLISWIERCNVEAGVMTLGQCTSIEPDWREENVNAIFGPRREPGEDD